LDHSVDYFHFAKSEQRDGLQFEIFQLWYCIFHIQPFKEFLQNFPPHPFSVEPTLLNIHQHWSGSSICLRFRFEYSPDFKLFYPSLCSGSSPSGFSSGYRVLLMKCHSPMGQGIQNCSRRFQIRNFQCHQSHSLRVSSLLLFALLLNLVLCFDIPWYDH